jgi:hypothetical protein
MSAVALNATPSFSERAQMLLDRLDYRRADTEEEREPIYRLRYEAYLREGAIGPSFGKRFADDFDETSNAWIFGLHIDGRLASSFRLHIASDLSEPLPGSRVFADILEPELAAGKTIIDPTRFVADPDLARRYPELPYLTVRLGYMAAVYVHADIVLATVRTEHRAFYKRVFGHRPVCDARPYPSLSKPISLMTLHYPSARQQIVDRYPFFRSTYLERRALFERPAQTVRQSRDAA